MSSPKEKSSPKNRSKYPIYHDIEQGSEAWFKLRSDKLSGSHAAAIQASGKGLETYVMELMASHYSKAIVEPYTNEHMARGIELEGQARELYEFLHDVKVDQVGFVQGGEHWGASPDGLTEEYGLEIKCHADKQHFNLILNGESAIEKKYWWQCQMNMLATGKSQWRLVCYNPNYKQNLLVFEIQKDEEAQSKLVAGIKKGSDMIRKVKLDYDNVRKEALGRGKGENETCKEG